MSLARPLARLLPFTVAAALWAAPPAFADAVAGAGLRVSGFGTLGLISASPRSDWGFHRETTQPAHHDTQVRADVDSRLGLQANWSPSAQWEVVGQLVLKPRSEESRWDDALAWGFVAYRPTPEWTVRLGRTSPDLFLLADVRNVGFAYPWARPSVEFYGWMPVSVLDGVDVTRQWSAFDAQWRAKLFAGRSRLTMAGTHDNGDTVAIMDSLAGGTLTAERNGLTLKATLAQARTRAVDGDVIANLNALLGTVAAMPLGPVADEAAVLRDSFPSDVFVTRYSAVGAIWEAGAWQWQAEIARVTGNFSASNNWYGYLSGAYRTGNFTWYGIGSRVKPNRPPLPMPNWTATLTPVLGPVYAGAVQQAALSVATSYNLTRQDQHTIAAGVRWDFNPQMAMKLQLDSVSVAPYGGGDWGYSAAEGHHANVLSVGLDFVF